MTKSELEHCIVTYGTEIYSFCRSITFNLQEADDLFQDTFVKAMELLDDIDSKQNPKSYLLSVACKLWKNKKRKHAWRSRIADILCFSEETDLEDMETAAFSPEQTFFEKEEASLVRQAVYRLPEKYKLPILLFYMEDLPMAQISFVLKIPVGTVKSRLHHAKKLLEKELEADFNEKHGRPVNPGTYPDK